MIITRTPLRISLIGGGTDVPEFYNQHNGAVVSFAINKYVFVSVNRKFDHRIRVSYSTTENVDNLDELHHDLARETLRHFRREMGVEVTSVSDIPGEGSGLGSSSAFTVGLINALTRGAHPSMLAENAYDIEANKCFHSVGKQDQYACAYGGLNYIRFGKNRVEIQKLFPKRDMQDNFLLLYTGATRSAESILSEQKQNFKNGKAIEYGKHLAELAYRFRNEYLEGMSPKRMGEFLHEGWTQKKQLAHVSSPEIDRLYEIAMRNGAHGGKLLGAGGGGFLFFVAPYETHAKITQETQLERVDFQIETLGSEVIYSG